MIINYENHDGYFYARNPRIDLQRRLTFDCRNCSHYLIISGTMDDEFNILKNGIIDEIQNDNMAVVTGDVVNIGKYKIRFVKHSTYVAVDYVQMDSKSSGYAVYGCKYLNDEDKLNIFIPKNIDEIVVSIPKTVRYKMKREMTEAKPGILGIGKKEAKFTGYYSVCFDDIQEYENGSIYYIVDGYNYYISQEMLGTKFYIRVNNEPVFYSTVKSLKLLKV